MAPRFGVVGTAHWAREVHLPGLIEAGLNVVGIWGRNEAAADEIAVRNGVRAFSRFDDLLAEVDVATFAVPPQIQADLALQAARAGKHLMLEKPVACDPAAAHALAEAVAERDLAAMVFFMRRFIPEVAAAIEAERSRDWREARVTVHASALVEGSPYANSVWRQTPGAALWDIGPHALSVLIAMMGPATSISSSDEEDGVRRFRTVHSRGGVAEVSMTLRAKPAQAAQTYRFASAERELILPDPQFSRRAVFGRAAHELAAAIASGRRDHPCGIRLGVTIVDLLAAAERSARTGVPEILGRAA